MSGVMRASDPNLASLYLKLRPTASRLRLLLEQASYLFRRPECPMVDSSGTVSSELSGIMPQVHNCKGLRKSKINVKEPTGFLENACLQQCLLNSPHAVGAKTDFGSVKSTHAPSRGECLTRLIQA